MTSPDLITTLLPYIHGGLFLCLALAIIRLVRGPTLADRIVALDLIGFITIGFMCTYTLLTNQTSFLDIALILALVAFLGTVAFARLIMSRANKDGEDCL